MELTRGLTTFKNLPVGAEFIFHKGGNKKSTATLKKIEEDAYGLDENSRKYYISEEDGDPLVKRMDINPEEQKETTTNVEPVPSAPVIPLQGKKKSFLFRLLKL